MGTSLLQSLGPDAAVIALKGRNIIAQVDRPGCTMYAVTPACKVGTKKILIINALFQQYDPAMCRPCRPDNSGNTTIPRPDDLG